MYLRGEWRRRPYAFVPPNGESILAGAERVRPALFALQTAAVDGDVLIVAHQLINIAIKVTLSGRSDPGSAPAFRQSHDQIDVWDMARGEEIERVRVELD